MRQGRAISVPDIPLTLHAKKRMTQKISYRIVAGRNGQCNRQGEVLLHVEAYQCGRKAYFSTHLHIRPECFEGGLVVNHQLASQYNAFLYRFRNDIEAVELELIAAGRTVSLAMLRAAVDGHVRLSATVRDFAATVIDDGGRGRSTLAAYEVCIKSVERFHPGCTLGDISYDWLVRFRKFLTAQGLSHNTVVGRLRSVRAIVYEAIKRDVIAVDANPFKRYSIPEMEARKESLTLDEVRRLERVELSDGRECRIRDLFLIGIYTGLRWSDLITLTEARIEHGVLTKTMHKTRRDVSIPIDTMFWGRAQEILSHYPDTATLCDVGHNASSNRTLREIAAKAGISKHLHWHLARKTHGKLMNELGFRAAEIQRELGHTKLETTLKHYAITDDAQVKNSAKKVFRKK